MHSPVYVAVFLFVVRNEPVDYLPGLLRGSRIIEINERFPMNQDVQDREIMPNMKNVKTHWGWIKK
jgi:hypothetical protein